jgi:hypothetical protein
VSDDSRANDYATGDHDGTGREEIEDRVREFDDANNGFSARVEFQRHGDYDIEVKFEGGSGFTVRSFETLWEFVDWTYQLEREAVDSQRELVAA